MIGWYERKMDSLGYDAEYLITHLAGVEVEIEPHVPTRRRLPPVGPPRVRQRDPAPPALPLPGLSDLELSSPVSC